ncbi:hypothetical protein B0O80DRAFT_460069 [Mortierella sp. GBAus27b]|nr:hypothetical protein BGX31_011364 [Mortierella sp. GBA43]KAI8349262.1 hypothetical protein B0O80DRAFT_460069 [Mortierella sp. GBAus27b]
MRSFHGLVVAMWALPSVLMAASIPAQFPLHLPSFPADTSLPVDTYRIGASNIYRGESPDDLLQLLANDMDNGLPQGWERLTRTPTTDGTFGTEAVSPSYQLDQVIQGWEIDENLLPDVKEDVRALTRVSVGKAAYAAQRFTYRTPHCNAGKRPACLTTLFVVVRPKIVVGNIVWTADLIHLYMRSGARTLQQTERHQYCERCWFIATCCYDYQRIRGLTPEENEQIQQVLSTMQAYWARIRLDDASPSLLTLM